MIDERAQFRQYLTTVGKVEENSRCRGGERFQDTFERSRFQRCGDNRAWELRGAHTLERRPEQSRKVICNQRAGHREFQSTAIRREEPKRGVESVYGIRPEYFTLSRANVGIPARVVVVEPLGSENHVTATVGEQTIMTVFHDRLDIEPEETIWLHPRTDVICLFDKSGQRLSIQSE